MNRRRAQLESELDACMEDIHKADQHLSTWAEEIVQSQSGGAALPPELTAAFAQASARCKPLPLEHGVPPSAGAQAVRRDVGLGSHSGWPVIRKASLSMSIADMLSRGRNLEGIYEAEVASELAKHPASAPGLISESDIAGLPTPVQRYFRASGFIGKPHTVNMRIHWRELQLKFSHDASWMKTSCRQFNSVPEPVRLVLMQGRMAAVIPFEGRDKYQDGYGNMLIKVMKVIPLGDSKGPQMDASALVTVLAEALMAPSYALQGYMRWEPVDDRSARAWLTYNGVTVSGTFHFNEADELIRFDTNDRWQDGTPPKKIPWSANIGGYRETQGIKYATQVSATWHEEGGDFTYAQGTIESLEFNVKD